MSTVHNTPGRIEGESFELGSSKYRSTWAGPQLDRHDQPAADTDSDGRMDHPNKALTENG
jgi:hypothetical protein